MTKSINYPRRLALLALSCLPGGRVCRPVRLGLLARTRNQVLAAGLKRAREGAGEGVRLAAKASAALTLSLRVLCVCVLEALRAGWAVSRPEPARQFGRLPLPVIDVPALPASDIANTQGKEMYVASPRKGRRPGKVRYLYRPFTGQVLKEGEHLAAREGRRYRRVETGEQAAA